MNLRFLQKMFWMYFKGQDVGTLGRAPDFLKLPCNNCKSKRTHVIVAPGPMGSPIH